MLQAAEEEEEEVEEQDKLNRTARVEPSPQAKDAEGATTPSTDRRK